MCASYGLERAGHRDGPPLTLPPLGELENALRLGEWIDAHHGSAKITGARARNLNPIITTVGGERRLEFGWWWLHVGGVPARFSAFNSRDDRLVSRWRAAFQTRALLPASWYVEKGTRFALPGEDIFAMAAVTTRVVEADGNDLVTYSLVTRDAIGQALTVHPRMPLIIPPQLHDRWLDQDVPGDRHLVDEVVAGSDELSDAARIVGIPGATQAALF